MTDSKSGESEQDINRKSRKKRRQKKATQDSVKGETESAAQVNSNDYRTEDHIERQKRLKLSRSQQGTLKNQSSDDPKHSREGKPKNFQSGSKMAMGVMLKVEDLSLREKFDFYSSVLNQMKVFLNGLNVSQHKQAEQYLLPHFHLPSQYTQQSLQVKQDKTLLHQPSTNNSQERRVKTRPSFEEDRKCQKKNALTCHVKALMAPAVMKPKPTKDQFLGKNPTETQSYQEFYTAWENEFKDKLDVTFQEVRKKIENYSQHQKIKSEQASEVKETFKECLKIITPQANIFVEKHFTQLTNFMKQHVGFLARRWVPAKIADLQSANTEHGLLVPVSSSKLQPKNGKSLKDFTVRLDGEEIDLGSIASVLESSPCIYFRLAATGGSAWCPEDKCVCLDPNSRETKYVKSFKNEIARLKKAEELE